MPCTMEKHPVIYLHDAESHLGVDKAGQKIKVSPSTIRDHISQSGHAASFKDFSVVDRANEFEHFIHQSFFILRDQPDLNSQQSYIPLQ